MSRSEYYPAKDIFKSRSDICFLDEPVETWNSIQDKNGKNIIEKYYENQEKYAFSFQMMAYISRISLLRKALKNSKNKLIITERSIFTDRNVFAKMLYDDDKIQEVEFVIYNKWFDEFINDISDINVIYLQVKCVKAGVADRKMEKLVCCSPVSPYVSALILWKRKERTSE